MKRFIWIIIFIWPILLYAKDTEVLFSASGQIHENYAQMLTPPNILPGEHINITPEVSFEFRRVLGQGFTTRVFEVMVPASGHRVALRLPFESAQHMMGDSRSFIDKFYQGFPFLQTSPLITPQILAYDKGKFLVVELLNLNQELSFENFFLQPHLFSAEDLLAAENELYTIAKETAYIATIGDFKGDQLYFDSSQKKWVLIDWSSKHTRASVIGDTHFLMRNDVVQNPNFLNERNKRIMTGIKNELQSNRLLLLERDRRLARQILDQLSSAETVAQITEIIRENRPTKHSAILNSMIFGTLFDELDGTLSRLSLNLEQLINLIKMLETVEQSYIAKVLNKFQGDFSSLSRLNLFLVEFPVLNDQNLLDNIRAVIQILPIDRISIREQRIALTLLKKIHNDDHLKRMISRKFKVPLPSEAGCFQNLLKAVGL